MSERPMPTRILVGGRTCAAISALGFDPVGAVEALPKLLEVCEATLVDWADNGISGCGDPLPEPSHIASMRATLSAARERKAGA